MPVERKRTLFWLTTYICAILFAAATILTGCRKKPEESSPSAHQNPKNSAPTTPADSNSKPHNTKPEPKQTNAEQVTSHKISLTDVIRHARYWGPGYTSWHGKMAPDFTLTDVAGKQHTLSDYRGKNVMLVFWATSCGPCILEMPHLIELRKTTSKDNLAILAITPQERNFIKQFAEKQKINYTVLLDNGNMPNPFGVIRIYRTTGIPCSFFIKPDGTIKLATTGLLPLDDMKAILIAQ